MLPDPGSLWHTTSAPGRIPLYDSEKAVGYLAPNDLVLVTGKIESDPDYPVVWVNILLGDGRAGWIDTSHFTDHSLVPTGDGLDSRPTPQRFTRRRR